MSDPLPSIFVAVASLVGAVLVFSGFRLYRIALATLGGTVGAATGWTLGAHAGSMELAAAGAILAGVAGAVLAGAVETALRFVGGALAAAALVGVATAGAGSRSGMSWALIGGAFVVGGVAALVLHRPLVVSALAAFGGLLVGAAGLVTLDPGLVQSGLAPTVEAVTEAMHGQLPSVLLVAAGGVAAAFLLQWGDDDPGGAGRRPAVRNGGLLLSGLLAGGLYLSLRPDLPLPGPAPTITGIGPLSWSLALLLLPAAVGLARRWGLGAGSVRGWLLGIAFGVAVGAAETFVGSVVPGEPVLATGYASTFADGAAGLRLAKAAWTLLGFPLLFSAMVLAPLGRGRPGSGSANEEDEGS